MATGGPRIFFDTIRAKGRIDGDWNRACEKKRIPAYENEKNARTWEACSERVSRRHARRARSVAIVERQSKAQRMESDIFSPDGVFVMSR